MAQVSDRGPGSEGERMRVFGIDPGSRLVGWAVVEGSTPTRVAVLASGVERLGVGSSAVRLGRLAERLGAHLEQWQPEEVALERAFVGANVGSALRLGEARGVVLALAGLRGLRVTDYSPATVKLAVAGHGRASKDEVATGVARLVGGIRTGGDETDALAVALCHLAHAGFQSRVAQALGARPRSTGRRAATAAAPVEARAATSPRALLAALSRQGAPRIRVVRR